MQKSRAARKTRTASGVGSHWICEPTGNAFGFKSAAPLSHPGKVSAIADSNAPIEPNEIAKAGVPMRRDRRKTSRTRAVPRL